MLDETTILSDSIRSETVARKISRDRVVAAECLRSFGRRQTGIPARIDEKHFVSSVIDAPFANLVGAWQGPAGE